MSHNGHLGAVAERDRAGLVVASGANIRALRRAQPRGSEGRHDAICPADAPAIRLLSDQVLIRLLEPERHVHGLWLPEMARRTASELWRGEVLAVGPGSRAERRPNNELMNPTKIWGETVRPCDVKPGDRVLFYFMAGKSGTQWPSKEYRIIPESMIQAVLCD